MAYESAKTHLNSQDAAVREQALQQLAIALNSGALECPETGRDVNMHCHTIYSYNGYGHSPSSLAWMAREAGWHAVGMVDFDVLDAVPECLRATDLLGIRAMAGMETRAFLPEFSTREVNSPGEPGVLYHVGAGFVTDASHSAAMPTEAARVLADMRARATQRNRDLVARLNAHLDPVSIDYDRDAVPLTPAGNVTERHMLVAYDAAARKLYTSRDALVAFWATKIGMSEDEVDAFLTDEPYPHDAIRSKLIKRGGVGYVQPGPETFPNWHDVNHAIRAAGAISVCAWLDGTSEGEQAMEELLGLQVEEGVAALNIIPDRNWNIKDPATREIKIRELNRVLDLARSLDLPVIVGTEMNKPGQRLVDDFTAEPLRPMVDAFVAGADFLYGHTLMQRALGRGYESDWAKKWLPTRSERNQFYTAVGVCAEPGPDTVTRVGGLVATVRPDSLLGCL